MQVSIKLFATLRKKLPKGSMGKATLDLVGQATINDLIHQLDIPLDLAQMVLGQRRANPGVRSGAYGRRPGQHLPAGGGGSE